jgi:hypothetical protein
MTNELNKNNVSPEFFAKLENFANLVESQQLERLAREGMTLEIHRPNYTARIRPMQGSSQKYIKVDVGTSGKYMVEISTGNIFGIAGYGQIHRGHQYGTLDTVAAWDWSGYRGQLRNA